VPKSRFQLYPGEFTGYQEAVRCARHGENPMVKSAKSGSLETPIEESDAEVFAGVAKT
jgi:hypothetical protein